MPARPVCADRLRLDVADLTPDPDLHLLVADQETSSLDGVVDCHRPALRAEEDPVRDEVEGDVGRVGVDHRPAGERVREVKPSPERATASAQRSEDRVDDLPVDGPQFELGGVGVHLSGQLRGARGVHDDAPRRSSVFPSRRLGLEDAADLDVGILAGHRSFFGIRLGIGIPLRLMM